MDVIQNLKASEKKLKELGPCRETKEQQQKYLLDLATRFQAMTARALEAHYDGAFESRQSFKLATLVVDRGESFADDICRKGHTKEFDDETKSTAVKGEGCVLPNLEASPVGSEPPAAMLATRQYDNVDDLDDLLTDNVILDNPANGIVEWLEDVYKTSRGFELGTWNASLMNIVWRKQSSKWEDLALGYTSDVVAITHVYIRDLLRDICVDDRVRAGIMSAVMDQLTERYKRAIDQTQFLLEVEENPLTFNHYFAQKMEEW